MDIILIKINVTQYLFRKKIDENNFNLFLLIVKCEIQRNHNKFYFSFI